MLLAFTRDQEKHNVESLNGVTGQPPKIGQEMDLEADLWDRGQHSKLNCPTLMG
jgi:hypothetical protein